MGLDMYLHRRRYVQNWSHFTPEQRREVTLTVGGREIELKDPAYIIEQVGYWCKANAIHAWFVDNIQYGEDDCKEYYVNPELLTDLKSKIEEALLQTVNSPDQPVLPTRAGFFFGGTEYDQYYLDDLRETLVIIEEALSDPEAGDLYYQSSW